MYKRTFSIQDNSDISKYQPTCKMIFYTVFALLLCSSLQSSTAFPIDPTVAVQAGIGFITDALQGRNLAEAAAERGVEAADAIALGDLARIAVAGSKKVDGGAAVEDVVDEM